LAYAISRSSSKRCASYGAQASAPELAEDRASATDSALNELLTASRRHRPPVTTNDTRQGSKEHTVGGFESVSWHLAV
jgi:hypothetical protein